MRKKADLIKAKKTALDLLEKYGFDRPPIDSSILAKKIGIKVFDCGFEDNNVSGYYDSDEEAIYVNKNEFIKRQQFTIAHELGHALLHDKWVRSSDYKCLYRDQLVKPCDDPKELEANEFAANLLVPTFLLNKYYDELKDSPDYLHEDIIQKISEIFFVSIPVIKIRLEREYGYVFTSSISSY